MIIQIMMRFKYICFENLDNFTPQREYMDQYIPYYTKAANDAHLTVTKNLLEKLNYLIHLMEK